MGDARPTAAVTAEPTRFRTIARRNPFPSSTIAWSGAQSAEIDLGGEERAHRPALLARAGERGEVVLSDRVGERRPDRGWIQGGGGQVGERARVRQAPGVWTERLRRRHADEIHVRPRERARASMEAARHAPGIQHEDPLRQPRVQRPAERVRVEGDSGPEPHDLRQRVHAGVGPRRHLQRRADADRPEGVLQRLLDCGQLRLALESAKSAAVVKEPESVEPSFHACYLHRRARLGARRAAHTPPHPDRTRMAPQTTPIDDPALEGGEWLFRRAGEVFGPVDSRSIAAMLYRGDLEPATPVSSGDGSWRPVGEIPLFVIHSKKAEAAHRVEREVTGARLLRARSQRRHSALVVAAAVLLVAAGLGGGFLVWKLRAGGSDRSRCSRTSAPGSRSRPP